MSCQSGRHSGNQSANANANTSNYSQVEQAVINASQPIHTEERERINAGKYSGLYLNKTEAEQFRGPIPLEQYQINDDPNPEVIKKKLNKLNYKQEISIKYLNPPPGPKPGDLVVREKQSQIPAGPPVVLRQVPCQQADPAPAVYREKPPKTPACIPEQVVEIEGCPIPPPPRRVVVEKLSSLPPKPQNIFIEKWLPYKQQKRRVRFEKAQQSCQQQVKNLIIEWEAPEVEVEKVCINLGVVDTDPEEYKRQYGCELKDSCEIPNLCCCPPPPSPPTPQCKPPTPKPASPQCGCKPATPKPPTPCGCKPPTPKPPTPQCKPPTPQCKPPTPKPASPQCGCNNNNSRNSVPELEGDIYALRRVDLDKHGLSAYRRYL